MASQSKKGPRARPPGSATDDEGWKTAPSREVPPDEPRGKDRRLDQLRKDATTPGRPHGKK